MSRFGLKTEPINPSQTYVKNGVRLSVITPRILRVERSADGVFEDRPTQMVFERNFANPQFSVIENGNKVTILTKQKEFSVDLKTLSVSVKKDGKWVSSHSGKNLKGTARTLDFSWGRWQLQTLRVKLGKGIFSTSGVTEIDDSKSYILLEDGNVLGRKKGTVDKYVFAFDDDYLGGLKEFYSLTGATPVLPKYSLGNWWSRYHAYTQEEYTSLMDKFIEKEIPLTVATIDMDWHLVHNLPKDVKKEHFAIQGVGWTGYTFDKNLFPDYKQFFKDLKSKGLAITMNLHPRDGVRYFEDQYEDMARANGIDPSTKKTVPFDCTDLNFMNSYFDYLHHPYEEDGVDFWWIDWQQGTKSKLKGFDPLWALNHYHTLDSGRDGRTPLILSRYAGIGSHRYPLGFSGDTFVRWSSLKLQPYFTANASNVGYTWWSHDIGGHVAGKGDGELYTRWVQFGTFSPINRLHSNNLSWSKEPWLYGDRAEKISTDFLRLRHRLLPYLYTANIRTARDGEPLVAPMYYRDHSPLAYRAKNQYYFGSELLVAPVVTKMKPDGYSVTDVYLPEGKWTDFFTGEIYRGGRVYKMRTPLDRMPVFAKAGAIIPMIAKRDGNSQKFDSLEVKVYAGEGEYRMFDEGGFTDFKLTETEGGYLLTINDDNNPQKADYKVTFVDREEETVILEKGQKQVTFQRK
ncbi:MAG: DUF4968 domain-containing protein [Clostridia bacterium]|nr:DUF4968 domain-containing protein [Clostridia bacterium]